MAANVTGTDPIVRVARVSGEALRRIAEAEKTWYREWIELPFLRSGMSRAETMHAASEFGGRARGRLAGIVQLSSQRHGGRPVKWLGDGVMFVFREPAEAVRSALEMVERTPAAGVPPAHVGVAAGTVIEQDGGTTTAP
jgi:hypothetical protein